MPSDDTSAVAAPQIRVLLLCPDGNPESISSALVGFSHSEALARHHAVTLVTHVKNEPALRRRLTPFTSIEAIGVPVMDRLYRFCFKWIFKGDFTSQSLTAFNYPFSLAFEWSAWRRLRGRILAGEFDVVLRVMPISAVLPSFFAFCLRNGPIPFVIGPINGGLPWPKGFRHAQQTREWLSALRRFYKVMPFAKSTYKHARAIVVGSSNTFREFKEHEHKVFFVPENGIGPSVYEEQREISTKARPLELIFVGGLVAIKACDLAIRGAAPLLGRGAAKLTIVGDGPERANLESLVRELDIEGAVVFEGMLTHGDAMRHMRAADVLVFPSIRDFGGAVVFEAMGSSVVPVVTDFGGPGDIVRSEVGFKVPLTDEVTMVLAITTILERLAADPALLLELRQSARRYALTNYTWDRKALIMTDILNWALGRREKPQLTCPRS